MPRVGAQSNVSTTPYIMSMCTVHIMLMMGEWWMQLLTCHVAGDEREKACADVIVDVEEGQNQNYGNEDYWECRTRQDIQGMEWEKGENKKETIEDEKTKARK